MEVKKAVILVAGFGTRFLPATVGVSKEMFPIVDKPILFYHLKECVDSGITDVLIISSKEKSDITKFLYPDKSLLTRLKQSGKLFLLDEYYSVINKLNIKIIYQRKKDGSGGACLLAKKWANGEPFMMFYGDDIFTSNVPVTKSMVDVYKLSGCAVGVMLQVDKKDVSRYGCARLGELKNGVQYVDDIIEKPKPENAPSNFALVGRYLLLPEVFDYIKVSAPSNGEYYLTEAIRKFAKTNKLCAIKLNGQYHDCGNKLEYAKTICTYMLSSPEYSKQFLQYIKEIAGENKN